MLRTYEYSHETELEESTLLIDMVRVYAILWSYFKSADVFLKFPLQRAQMSPYPSSSFPLSPRHRWR
jgi:hypothetical protein